MSVTSVFVCVLGMLLATGQCPVNLGIDCHCGSLPPPPLLLFCRFPVTFEDGSPLRGDRGLEAGSARNETKGTEVRCTAAWGGVVTEAGSEADCGSRALCCGIMCKTGTTTFRRSRIISIAPR